MAFEGLRPLLKQRNPALETQIAANFATVQALLEIFPVEKTTVEEH